jgi:hypothetical protein
VNDERIHRRRSSDVHVLVGEVDADASPGRGDELLEFQGILGINRGD